jgi:hypothetical protein
MRRIISRVALLIIAVAGSASAQASIDPGMSHDQVLAKLGKPSSEHSSGTKTYLYYPNGQEKKMGMSDMVALEDGKVVDAVFRSSSRRYSGKSSSPAPVSEEAAIIKGGGTPSSKPMRIPAKRLSEPMKRVGAKKIEPMKKSDSSNKQAPPAPAKKP